MFFFVCFGECVRDVALARDIFNAPPQSVFGMNIKVLETDTFGTVPHYMGHGRTSHARVSEPRLGKWSYPQVAAVGIVMVD